MTARSRYRARRLVAATSRWAHAHDNARRTIGVTANSGLPHGLRISWIARCWATLKLGVVGLLSPVWAPMLMVRAAANNRRARELTALFPARVRTIAKDGNPPPPANQVVDVASNIRLAIFSDLHRCVPGRLDWPKRQGTKDLYAAVLDVYGSDEWYLCENGDIEDFWMVGGSTYGSAYDALRMTGAALARFDRSELLVETYRAHLDAIIANNEEIYRRLREQFVITGRYLRTVGNHDNPIARPMVADHLRQQLGTFPVSDYIALRTADGSLSAIITHGHHTDGWNAPERDNLGKLSSWISNTLVDVPRLRTPEGLPPVEASRLLMSGEMPDRLIRVSPTFGANSSYDSLDEELLFDAVHREGLDDIWMLLGHTHSPVSSPRSRSGDDWTRYLNSGSGVTEGIITAIEWDGTGAEVTAVLVAWSIADESTPLEALVRTPSGVTLSRMVLEPNEGRLRPVVAPRSVSH